MSLKKFSLLLPNSYHYLAASCFSLFNQPEVVPSIFESARRDLAIKLSESSKGPTEVTKAEMHLARQFREALLRAGLFGGMSKAINSLQSLHKNMPPMLRESYAGVARQTAPVPGKKAPAYTEFLEQGREFLTEVYGQTQAQHIEDALYTMSPRLGHYAVPLVYGGVYADTTALSIREACVLMFMCNMAVDTPKQAIGHIDSSRRQGATKGDLLNVGIMVRSIAEMYNVKLTKWELIMETVDTDVVNDRNPYEV